MSFSKLTQERNFLQMPALIPRQWQITFFSSYQKTIFTRFILTQVLFSSASSDSCNFFLFFLLLFLFSLFLGPLSRTSTAIAFTSAKMRFVMSVKANNEVAVFPKHLHLRTAADFAVCRVSNFAASTWLDAGKKKKKKFNCFFNFQGMLRMETLQKGKLTKRREKERKKKKMK